MTARPDQARPEPAPRYLDLSERAARLLADRPDGASPAELAGALFGGAVGDRWNALLDGVLGRDARFVRRADRWFAAGARALAPTEPDLFRRDASPAGETAAITTLALATTGADPRRHRVVRVAVVRRELGAVAARFDAVIRPELRPARSVIDAARIVADDLDETPPFDAIAPDLAAALGDAEVYAYGAARAAAFLDAECRRAGLPPLGVRLREIDGLLGAVHEPDRKPGLRAAARALGLPPLVRPSPLAEADLAGRIVERLREREAASPSRATASAAAAAETGGDAPLPFTRAWLADIPAGPGVYVIEDERGQALYVGKAVALRRRLAAYVQRPPTLHRRLEALGVRAAATSVVETASDLEATLLEARLVGERRPSFNVARETAMPTLVIRVAPEASASPVRLVRESAPDGARYFGPYESVRAAREALVVARAAFPVAFERGSIDAAGRRAAADDVCRLLAGQKDRARAALRAAMREAATIGDRPAVDRLRTALLGVQALESRPSIQAGLSGDWRLCVSETLPDGRRRGHLLHVGRLVASCDLDPVEPSVGPADGVAPRADDKSDAPLESSDAAPPADCACRVAGARDAGAGERPATGLDPAVERTIALRWLVQARRRIAVHRLLNDRPAGD